MHDRRVRELRIVDRYQAPSLIQAIAFGDDEVAYADRSGTWTSKGRAYEGWTLLGYTDEHVLLGFRCAEDRLEIADLARRRVGLVVPNARHATLSADGGWLAVAIPDGYQLIDVSTTEVVETRPAIGRANERLVAVAPFGMAMLVAGAHLQQSDDALLYPLRVRARRRWVVDDTECKGVAFSHDGRAFGWVDRRAIRIVRWLPWRPDERPRSIEVENCRGIAFHPTRELFATLGRDLEIRTFDGELVARARDRNGSTALAFAADGHRLATGSFAGDIDVYDTKALA